MEKNIITREASELGWKPGYVPHITFVQGLYFEFVQSIVRGDEVIAWKFISHFSQSEVVELTVYND